MFGSKKKKVENGGKKREFLFFKAIGQLPGLTASP